MSRSRRSCATLLLKTPTAVFRELKEALDATLVVIRLPNFLKTFRVLANSQQRRHADTRCIEEADRRFSENLEEFVVLVQRRIIRLQHVYEKLTYRSSIAR